MYCSDEISRSRLTDPAVADSCVLAAMTDRAVEVGPFGLAVPISHDDTVSTDVPANATIAALRILFKTTAEATELLDKFAWTPNRMTSCRKWPVASPTS